MDCEEQGADWPDRWLACCGFQVLESLHPLLVTALPCDCQTQGPSAQLCLACAAAGSWGGACARPALCCTQDRLAAVTVHHYGAGGQDVTAESLLSESVQRSNMKALAAVVDTADKHGLPAYITEGNSITGGGRNDISNALAGLL